MLTADRYNNQSEVAEAIVRRLLPNNPVALKIQEQLVLEQKPLAETDAGTFVHEEMIKLEKRHQENLQAVKEEMERASKESEYPQATSHWCVLMHLLGNEALKQDLEQAHARALADIQKVQEAKVQLLENKVRRVQLENKQDLEAQRAEHNRKLERSQQENRERMNSMQRDHASRISDVKSEGAQAIAKIEKSHSTEMKDLESRNRSEISAVRSEHSARMESATREANRALQELQNKQDGERDRQNDEIRKLRSKVDDLETEKSAVATTSSSSEDSVSTDALILAVQMGALYGAARSRLPACSLCQQSLTSLGYGNLWQCPRCCRYFSSR